MKRRKLKPTDRTGLTEAEMMAAYELDAAARRLLELRPKSNVLHIPGDGFEVYVQRIVESKT